MDIVGLLKLLGFITLPVKRRPVASFESFSLKCRIRVELSLRLDDVGAEDEDDELVDALIVSKLLLGIETKAPLGGTFIFSLEMLVSISIVGASLFVAWSI